MNINKACVKAPGTGRFGKRYNDVTETWIEIECSSWTDARTVKFVELISRYLVTVLLATKCLTHVSDMLRENYGCLGGAAVGCRTRDRKVAGSTPGRGAIKSTRLTQPSIPPG